MSRQRDILPLLVPSLDVSSFLHRKVSRAVKRRVLRKSHAAQWMADGVDSLNELSGSFYDNAPSSACNAAQHCVLNRLRRLYGAVPPPDSSISPAGAFSALCGS